MFQPMVIRSSNFLEEIGNLDFFKVKSLKFLCWLKSMKALYISKESISVGSISHSGPQPYTHPALPASP